jgi:hypothetical protein
MQVVMLIYRGTTPASTTEAWNLDEAMIKSSWCYRRASTAGRSPVCSSASSDWRTLGEARPLLLAAAGREPCDPTAVRVDAPANLGPAGPNRLTVR